MRNWMLSATASLHWAFPARLRIKAKDLFTSKARFHLQAKKDFHMINT